MGSRMRRMTFLVIVVLLFAVLLAVVYANRGNFQGNNNKSAEGEAVSEEKALSIKQIGSDTRAFLEDETFFDSDKKPYTSIDKMEGNRLTLLLTSVQKDLRIQVVDHQGKSVKGKPFCVVLNEDKEYLDEDEDGIFYIEFLRAGEYSVVLKEVEGYRVPETATTIEVKQNVEYVAIDDISNLIFTEDEVEPELEDKEVKDALVNAHKSEIKKMQTYNPNAKIGIDVSKWNGPIDWDQAKTGGVEFAIIRVGYRGAATGVLVQDPLFEAHMNGATQAGIPVGVYFFTQAINEIEALEEASMVSSLIEEYDLAYPVFIDTEGAGGNGRADSLDVEMRTKVCKAFNTTMENEGYRSGVYGSRQWFDEKLTVEDLKDAVMWLAEYRDVPLYQGYYHMWQYTSQGKIDGIEGNVDLNVSYLKIDETQDSGQESDIIEEE